MMSYHGNRKVTEIANSPALSAIKLGHMDILETCGCSPGKATNQGAVLGECWELSGPTLTPC